MKQYIALITSRLGSWRYRWLATYSAIVLAVGLSYMAAQRIIIDQSSSFVTVISNITLNLILLFGMWGIISDKATKRLPKWAGWTIFFIGLFCMVLFLTKGAGFETRFR
jgi:hypothetical protein